MKNLIVSILLFSSTLIFAQGKTIRGKVTDENGQPLSGANVLVVGKHIGVSTNNEGIFQLTANFKGNEKIKISFLGFRSKILNYSAFKFSKMLLIKLKSKILSSQTILVQAVVHNRGEAPVTFSQIKRKEIENSYVNQDVPEFLSYLPSTTFYSENGNGIGYNYLSIRGFDQRRIAVSVNGVPQNDPEDHNIYWLDMPDLLGSAGVVEVQRGAGAGIVGYPSIGGSINIITSPFSAHRRFSLSTTLGSYNTRKYNVSLASGLIGGKYSLYASLSNILSSGYRDWSWVNFKSYYIAAVRYDKNFTTQINLYGGPIADGLAYTGLPKWTIKDVKLRRENYSYWESDGKRYTWTTRRRTSEIENFFQPHFELLNEYDVNKNLKLNSTLFLVIGNGFFDYDGSWADTTYLRLTSQYGFHPAQNPSNVLIRAMVENTQLGWIPRVSWKHNNGRLTAGLEFRKHRSKHWGSVNFGENLPLGLTKDYRYYYYEGGKNIFNAFVNENYKLGKSLSLLGEAQLAYHEYLISNEKYVSNNFTIDGLYLNARLGANYKFNKSLSGYFSFARVTREPRLKNYYDAAESSGGALPQFKTKTDGSYDFTEPLVKPETMNDFELGANYGGKTLGLTINFYYMIFDNEIVKKGQVDRFGQPITGNMERTIHSGVEFTANLKLSQALSVAFNATASNNKIDKGKRFIKYKDSQTQKKKIAPLDLSGNQIAGFPNYIFNLIANVNVGNFSALLTAKYVGDFYSDNFGSKLNAYLANYPGFVSYSDNKVDAYFVVNLLANYSFQLKPVFENVKAYLQINNVFNKLYAANAIGGEFFPAAERNFLAGVKVSF